MRLRGTLSANRLLTGTIEVIDDTGAVIKTARCLGNADHAEAVKHGNVHDDPSSPYGDHPSGLYLCTRVVQDPSPKHSYGGWLIDLDPCGATDEAARAKATGRTGLAIHAGDLNVDGTLRATFGCLRVDEETMDFIAPLVREKLYSERVFYTCEILA